jgi:group II intron reverse transcriptase/maturase
MVLRKRGNHRPRDPVEGKRCRATEISEGKMTDTKRSEDIHTRLRHVAKQAKEHPDWVMTTLAQHIDIEFLKEAYRRTRKDGAAGIDGQTASQYEERLEENLGTLLNQFKSGSYWAPPVKRVYIPKAEGKKLRPIGIPTLEDKVLQRAVAMVLEAVYEQDFMNCSYGFRPGRNAHQAVQALWEGLMKMGGGWVLEADIKGFFDNMSHAHLRGFLDLRVRDGVMRRVIGKWLKAGVLEEGSIRYSNKGSPQGGVISPLLANIYLHEVLDRWFEGTVKPRMKGAAFLVRYADDFVLVFSLEADARRVLEVLPKRFGKYGLELHPEKTRLVEFCKPKDADRGGRSFDLLGFTHYWGKSLKGKWVVKRKTAKGRFRRACRAVAEWCRENRHKKVSEQHQALCSKLRGHLNYYGITGNGDMLDKFVCRMARIWRKWLNRRSGHRSMPWERFNQLKKRYPFPKPIVIHSVYRCEARL